MPYTDPCYYVTFGGTIAGQEEWQTGFKCWPLLGNPARDVVTLAGQLQNISVADILGDVNALMAAGGTNPVWDVGVTVVWAKVAVLTTEGKYYTDPIRAEQAPKGGIGGSGCPWPQLAVCVSMWSGSNLGRANHGRMYLPCPAQITCHTVTGQIDPISQVNNLRVNTQKMIEAINGEVSTITVSTSPAIMSKLGTGTTKVAEHVGVGPVMDTMRSRRRHLDDDVQVWSTVPWAHGRSVPKGAPVIVEHQDEPATAELDDAAG